MNRIQERKAISGAIMALILIGIAVVAGIVVFTAFNTSSGTAGIRNAFAVDTLSLVNADGEDRIHSNGVDNSTTSDTLMLTATLKNTGSKAIQNVTIALMIDNGNGGEHVEAEGLLKEPVAPGESVRVEMHADEGTGSDDIDFDVDINLGRSIPIHIIAKLVDGSEVDITTRAIIS